MFDDFAPCSGESGTVQAQFDRLGGLDVDLIRDAALNLELRNQPMALKLMKLALRFRPTGPAIKKKISEWES